MRRRAASQHPHDHCQGQKPDEPETDRIQGRRHFSGRGAGAPARRAHGALRDHPAPGWRGRGRHRRPAGGGWVWELPAGRLEPGEPPEHTARRELVEEAGCEAASWESLGDILSSPGVFAETIHLYLARDLTPRPSRHEEYEVIEVHWVPLEEALAKAVSGELRDGKTVIGLLRAAHRIHPR
jgi:8-oxo-dGTP pyrophosphatase MutT (NUDIX family)